MSGALAGPDRAQSRPSQVAQGREFWERVLQSCPPAHHDIVRMRMNGFSFDVEVLVMARQRGYRVTEVPVNWTHKPGSKVHLTLDSLRMASDQVAGRPANGAADGAGGGEEVKTGTPLASPLNEISD